jgi:hypothetical protein
MGKCRILSRINDLRYCHFGTSGGLNSRVAGTFDSMRFPFEASDRLDHMDDVNSSTP